MRRTQPSAASTVEGVGRRQEVSALARPRSELDERGARAGPLFYSDSMAAPVRIGTCSWADDALSKHWYPPGTPPQERLPYYAERFSTVEVDSTYYRVPPREMVQGWADRTPDGFVMHVKAFGLMTRHPVKLEQVPPDLREGLPVDERGRVDRPPREARAAVFREFLERARRRCASPGSSAASSSRCRRTSSGSRRRSTTSSGRATRSAPTSSCSSRATARGSPTTFATSCCAGSRSGG